MRAGYAWCIRIRYGLSAILQRHGMLIKADDVRQISSNRAVAMRRSWLDDDELDLLHTSIVVAVGKPKGISEQLLVFFDFNGNAFPVLEVRDREFPRLVGHNIADAKTARNKIVKVQSLFNFELL